MDDRPPSRSEHRRQAVLLVDPVGDPDGYAQGKDLWLAQVAKMTQSAPVLANAGRYFQTTDPRQAQDFFQKAIAADPTNPVWPNDLANLYVEALHRAPDSDWRASRPSPDQF